MANGAQRMDDANSGGGVINSIPQSTVFVEGKLVAVNGSTGTTHPPAPLVIAHAAGVWSTANGSSTVFISGIPVNADGDSDTCGDVRVSGSATVFFG
jgi:uncharacterized Zn-binding protein involved in type VI secretion